MKMIQFILSTGRANPIAQNNHKQMPFELISPHHDKRFLLQKLFEPFQECRINYPVESYSKIFLCGNSNAGKSSLARIITLRASMPVSHMYDPLECVDGVELQTAGIIYHNVQSHEIGNVILYDFAGHKEYYSSHAAVLENVLLRSPAIFIILADLTLGITIIEKELYYWFNFIENVSTLLERPSQTIVVGSRADLLSDDDVDISTDVAQIAKKATSNQTYSGFRAMDCHRPGGKGVQDFLFLLAESCQAVLDRSDSISYYCHVLYSFLLTLQVIAISLKDLTTKLTELNDPSLPSNTTVLINFLVTLSDRGLILFLKRDNSSSWIIIDKAALLKEVNGTLFAPKAIPRVYRNVASNTGLVHVSALKETFPQYDTDMLVGFLRNLKFCHIIDPITLKYISTNVSLSLSPNDLLYFPALVKTQAPSNINIANGVGWTLWCSDPNQFLSTRFLHILLFHLAYDSNCLPCCDDGKLVTNKAVQQLTRGCDVWINGIHWFNELGYEAMVEVTEHNRCVTVVMSQDDNLASYHVFCSLVEKVYDLQRHLCPACTTTTYLISPDCVANIRDIEVENRILYAITDVARSVLRNNKVVINSKRKGQGAITEIVGNQEPYLYLVPPVIQALFNENDKDLPLRDDYLQHIQEGCAHVMSSYPLCEGFTHISVRNHLNQFSIFGGCNPLVCCIIDLLLYTYNLFVLYRI